MKNWWNEHISGRVPTLVNLEVPVLVERCLQERKGELSADGALVVHTGKFTGRAADDKYVVDDDYSHGRIDWKNNINTMKADQFEKLRDEFSKYINGSGEKLYIMERSVGADSDYSLGVRVITTSPSHALFAHHMFRPKTNNPKLNFFTVYHCPELEPNPKEHNLKSSTVIAINFTSREVIILGTGYAGEMKKAIFSVMNVLLPDAGVLPMHSGSNVDDRGNVSVFFGLSGTGKTTLSTDIGLKLIGDDEHGLSEDGIFNIEGGCYAKTYKLTAKGEPQVYFATNHFGSLIENVKLDEKRRPLFDDKSITENGRSSYPLNFISDSVASGMGNFPKNIFFLSADAMGVLPAVAKLNPEQAMYYFLSGYTAKLAGTELGLAGIKAAFSHCFGAPFMMRHPETYAELLKHFMQEHDLDVWLINTGWCGGAYGVGERYDLSVTRQIIRAIQRGLPADTQYENDSVFDLSLPVSIPGVESKFLRPDSLWKDKDNYRSTAEKLRELFEENYKKFETKPQVFHKKLATPDYPSAQSLR